MHGIKFEKERADVVMEAFVYFVKFCKSFFEFISVSVLVLKSLFEVGYFVGSIAKMLKLLLEYQVLLLKVFLGPWGSYMGQVLHIFYRFTPGILNGSNHLLKHGITSDFGLFGKIGLAERISLGTLLFKNVYSSLETLVDSEKDRNLAAQFLDNIVPWILRMTTILQVIKAHLWLNHIPNMVHWLSILRLLDLWSSSVYNRRLADFF